MTYREKCLQKFIKLPQSIRDLFGGKETIKHIDQINSDFDVNIDFLIILLAIQELMIYDIDIYISKKFNIDIEKSRQISSKINGLIINPIIDKISKNEMLLDDLFLHFYNKRFIEFEEDLEAQKRSPEFYLDILPTVLSSNIFYLLDSDDEYKKIINDVLIYLLSDDKDKRQIEDYIYNNNQILFDKPFILEDKQIESNISNWIKDYIGQYGIDKYDDLFLSEFVNDSKNAKILDESEKNILYGVLKFYLNIKFYPEIFENLPDDSWNLFPAEMNKENIVVEIPQKKIFIPETDDIKQSIEKIPEKKVSNMDTLLNSYKNFDLSFKNLEIQITKDLKLKKSTDLDEEFLNFINTNKIKEAMVVLSYVCSNNLINIFFKDNKILQKDFKKFLENKFSEDTINNIMEFFGTVESVSLFLQFLLIEKLRLIPKDMGLFGMYLANVFKKSKQEKYFPIVYGDVNSTMFIFREIKDVAGKLVIK
ncbi:MAG TPA: hypothetical protein PKL13_02200 [bacterium]|nr:hypothetical protein [bacterium]